MCRDYLPGGPLELKVWNNTEMMVPNYWVNTIEALNDTIYLGLGNNLIKIKNDTGEIIWAL